MRSLATAAQKKWLGVPLVLLLRDFHSLAGHNVVEHGTSCNYKNGTSSIYKEKNGTLHGQVRVYLIHKTREGKIRNLLSWIHNYFITSRSS